MLSCGREERFSLAGSRLPQARIVYDNKQTAPFTRESAFPQADPTPRILVAEHERLAWSAAEERAVSVNGLDIAPLRRQATTTD